MGAFVVSSGHEAFQIAADFEKKGDDYTAIIIKSLADRFAEALAEYTHQQMRFKLGTESESAPLATQDLLNEKFPGIRPAPGYAASPDHTHKGVIWSLLDVQKTIGATLTENFAMDPPGTVAAWVIPNPKAFYFATGQIGEDQFKNYVQFNNWTPEIGKKWLGSVFKR